ncbi:MAG TPA: LacI family DNA-binding transcriptional regulator [Mycobacteriales bacterium]|jgi:DNA-binding LacI/PurR family transcriptional regulator|nr:LacI family DNA-binding transcriptional regulator [Mycobacteriales bacterium]
MPTGKRTRRTATLASLAAELGVSRTTVSNAYNRPDQLSPQLRERVLDAAKRLGYPGPDPLARSLRTRQAGAVGLLLTEALSYAFRDPGAVAFLEGLALACEDARTGLLLVPAVEGSGTDPAVVARASVDGFVVYSMPAGNPFLQTVLERPVPTVIVDEPAGQPGVDFVGVDDRGGMAEVGRHLAQLGHRRVGVVSSALCPDNRTGLAGLERQRGAAYHVVRDRLEGLAEGLATAGVAWGSVPVQEMPANALRPGREGAHALLETHPDLTAIVAMSDIVALGVLEALAERGRSDISVTGFDDTPAAREAGLTTVHQPLLDKGRIAGELLFDTGDRPVPRTRILPATLVVRESTRPVPA